MNDPQRLLSGDATSLEHELLSSVLNEPIPAALQARMLAVLPLTDVALNSGLGSGAGSATTATASTGLKALLVSLGAGSVLTALWVAAPPFTTPTNAHDVPGVAAGADQEAALPATPSAPTPQADVRGAAAVLELPAATSPETMPQAAAPRPVSAHVRSAAAQRSDKRNSSQLGSSELPHTSRPVAQGGGNRVDPVPATLSAELRLLDAARRAIAQGDKTRSLQVLDTYARQFPHGDLVNEAKVLRNLAQQNGNQ